VKAIRELLREADPLKHEPTWPSGERDLRRKAILMVASDSRPPARSRLRSRIAVFAAVTLIVIAVSFLSSRVWLPFVSNVQAAVHFEVRLAEVKPAPGLREAKVLGSERSVYLYDEAIVDNSDIASAQVVQGSPPSQYAVDVKFNASGAEKMRAATAGHIGKPIAILIDGQVVMAPVVRSAISASAVVSGNFTRAQAEKIVSGIGIQ
jgi:hypothetical protein